MADYQVVVGNIGTVYRGTKAFEANRIYNAYVGQSKRGYGRAAYEDVVLFRDGEIIKEHIGKQQNPISSLNDWLPCHAIRVTRDGRVQILNPKRSSRHNPEMSMYGGREGKGNFREMTLDEVKRLQYGQHIWVRGRGNTAVRVKINSQVKRWKTDPDRVEVSLKYGLYENYRATNRDIESGMFLVKQD